LHLPKIPIPPIALRVLQRARSYDQLSSLVLAMRDEFKDLRATMHDLSEIIADPQLSSSQYIRLVENWDQRWKSIADDTSTCTFQIGKTAASLLSGAVALATAAPLAAVSAGLGLVGGFSGLKGQLALRPVHLSVSNYVHSHPHETVAVVSSIFSLSPVRVQEKLDKVALRTKSVWRQALGI
jgi:hypothetical protein